jgi:FkbM family methyltransferase
MNLLRSGRVIVKRLIEPWRYSTRWSIQSYSQEGEDLVLDRIMRNDTPGFYLDIGAHHPFRFSNTYLFYRKGWSGICIDPLPSARILFEKWRPRDKFIETGVSETPSSTKYYMFDEPAYNTFDAQLSKERVHQGLARLVETKTIPTDTLRNILDQHLPENNKLVFMSVDVEGYDLQVLKSNDWTKYRPDFIIAECLQTDIVSVLDDPLVKYLSGIGYTAHSKLHNSVMLINTDTQ